MFDHTVFRDAAPRLPLLSEKLRFNESGFICTKDLFLKWKKDDLDRIDHSGDIHECLLENEATIDSFTLNYLLRKDLSFKGRDYIPQAFLNTEG